MGVSEYRPQRSRFLLSVPRWKDGLAGDLPEVAIGGRSNVGKSSLINALLGRRALARTSSTPGRTQALNYFVVDERFVLVDLPGYGFARAPRAAAHRWSENVKEYVTRSNALRAVILLLDIRREPGGLDLAFARGVREAGRPLVPVITKCDKVSRGRRPGHLQTIGRALGCPVEDLVATSAKTGEGRAAVWERVLDRVGK